MGIHRAPCRLLGAEVEAEVSLKLAPGGVHVIDSVTPRLSVFDDECRSLDGVVMRLSVHYAAVPSECDGVKGRAFE